MAIIAPLLRNQEKEHHLNVASAAGLLLASYNVSMPAVVDADEEVARECTRRVEHNTFDVLAVARGRVISIMGGVPESSERPTRPAQCDLV